MNLKLEIRIIAILIVILLSYGCENDVSADYMAPDFSLNDLSGQPVTLSQYSGNIVLLDFWATWCQPCRMSIPELVDIQKRYNDQGVVILGVSLDDPKQFNNNYLRAFKKKFKMNYPVLRSSDEMLRDYFGNRQISIPTMYIIDRKGKISGRHVGFQAGAVERSLKKLIP